MTFKSRIVKALSKAVNEQPLTAEDEQTPTKKPMTRSPKPYITNSEAETLVHLAYQAQEAREKWENRNDELCALTDKIRFINQLDCDAPLVGSIQKPLNPAIEGLINRLDVERHHAALAEREALLRIQRLLIQLVPPPAFADEEAQIAARVAYQFPAR